MLFTHALEHEDGSPAEPATFHPALSAWKPGDTIPLGAGRTLRLVDTRPSLEPCGAPVLEIEPA
jgi:hypothetical protein